jgi:hypothetical protein
MKLKRTPVNVNTKSPLNGTFTAIFYYFWLIVYSYYRQLKNELASSSIREEENGPLAVLTYSSPK